MLECQTLINRLKTVSPLCSRTAEAAIAILVEPAETAIAILVEPAETAVSILVEPAVPGRKIAGRDNNKTMSAFVSYLDAYKNIISAPSDNSMYLCQRRKNRDSSTMYLCKSFLRKFRSCRGAISSSIIRHSYFSCR